MAELFSTCFYALRYNLLGLLFFGAVWYFARKNRTFWHWYLFGVLVQGYSILGTVMGVFMEPDQWRTPGNYAAIGLFVILALVCLLYCWNEEKRFPSQERKEAAQKAAQQQKK